MIYKSTNIHNAPDSPNEGVLMRLVFQLMQFKYLESVGFKGASCCLSSSNLENQIIQLWCFLHAFTHRLYKSYAWEKMKTAMKQIWMSAGHPVAPKKHFDKVTVISYSFINLSLLSHLPENASGDTTSLGFLRVFHWVSVDCYVFQSSNQAIGIHMATMSWTCGLVGHFSSNKTEKSMTSNSTISNESLFFWKSTKFQHRNLLKHLSAFLPIRQMFDMQLDTLEHES